MTLAAQQDAFMAQVLDEDAPLPPGWTARHGQGLAIYRNAYRARLVDALRETYERTARWVGEDAFRAAAAHHVISTPPRSWSLDHVGDGFVAVLEQLFANDPEVAELAWLEWAMHRAFVAADTPPLDAAGFAAATCRFDAEDWAGLQLGFLPSLHLRKCAHDVGSLWNALAQDGNSAADYCLTEPRMMIVWREDLRTTFMPLEALEAQGLAQMLAGSSYGAMVASLAEIAGDEAAIGQAGAMLGRWLATGLLAGVGRNVL